MADHGMLKGKCHTAAAGLGCIFELPVISKAHGILKLTLVKKGVMFSESQSLHVSQCLSVVALSDGVTCSSLAIV